MQGVQSEILIRADGSGSLCFPDRDYRNGFPVLESFASGTHDVGFNYAENDIENELLIELRNAHSYS